MKNLEWTYWILSIVHRRLIKFIKGIDNLESIKNERLSVSKDDVDKSWECMKSMKSWDLTSNTYNVLRNLSFAFWWITILPMPATYPFRIWIIWKIYPEIAYEIVLGKLAFSKKQLSMHLLSIILHLRLNTDITK